MTTLERSQAVRAGKLRKAIAALGPAKPAGPWHVLCEQAYQEAGVNLWRIPFYSPDLKPVEKSGLWLRRKLLAIGLKDVVAKRPISGEMAYKAGVKSARAS